MIAGSAQAEREESPDSDIPSKAPLGFLRVKGNAPGNARGLRTMSRSSAHQFAATESATENRPPVTQAPLRQVFGKTGNKPSRARSFGKGEKVG